MLAIAVLVQHVNCESLMCVFVGGSCVTHSWGEVPSGVERSAKLSHCCEL